MKDHPFHDMAEPELASLMNRVARRVESVLPDRTGFVVLVAPRGPNEVAQYVCNSDRHDCIAWLRETADRMEAGDVVERSPWT